MRDEIITAPLPREIQGELDKSWQVALRRVELAKSGVGDVRRTGRQVGEPRPVEGIHHLEAELHPHLFGDWEVLRQ
jgi:hypothetical protein